MIKRKRLKTDSREVRKVRAWCKKSKLEILLQEIDEVKLKKRSIQYLAPNNIALSLNIALSASTKAKKFYDEVLNKVSYCKSEYKCRYFNHSDIYDYLEQIQISVIFAFTAVESFANIAIPDNFTYERLNNKGIREVLTKENIERWCSTTEKVEAILPLVFGIKGPKESPFWSDFKMLEKLRNDIVHPKTTSKKMEIPTDYLKRFFDVSIFRIFDSARSVINHFCVGRAPLAYFPHIVGSKGPAADLTMAKGSISKHIKPIKSPTKTTKRLLNNKTRKPTIVSGNVKNTVLRKT
jgi:hypothetical protein